MGVIDKVSVGGTSYDVQDSASVHFTEQTLSAEQAMQARSNVGAASYDQGLYNLLAAVANVHGSTTKNGRRLVVDGCRFSKTRTSSTASTTNTGISLLGNMFRAFNLSGTAADDILTVTADSDFVTIPTWFTTGNLANLVLRINVESTGTNDSTGKTNSRVGFCTKDSGGNIVRSLFNYPYVSPYNGIREIALSDFDREIDETTFWATAIGNGNLSMYYWNSNSQSANDISCSVGIYWRDPNDVRTDAQAFTGEQQRQVKVNISAEDTPEGSIIGQIATVNYQYGVQNYRQVTVSRNHVIVTRTNSSGSTNFGKSLIGKAYSTATDTDTINNATNRATCFKDMYTAGAYVTLDSVVPFFRSGTTDTSYYLRIGAYVETGTGTQRVGITLGTYNPDTDTVVECGTSDAMGTTIDGSTVYLHPLLREYVLTDAFIEAVNANKNIMALLCIRSGGSDGSILHLVWDIEPRREYHTAVEVSGSTVDITANPERYVCTASAVTELSFTPCSSGVCSVRFKSGTTATVLSLPNTVKMPDWWTGVEASKTYEISIADGVYGVVTSWT